MCQSGQWSAVLTRMDRTGHPDGMHHLLSLRSCLTALVVSCAAAAFLATPSLAIAPVHVTIAGSLQKLGA